MQCAHDALGVGNEFPDHRQGLLHGADGNADMPAGRRVQGQGPHVVPAALEDQLSALGSEEAAAAAAANGAAVDPETGAPLTGADIMEINTEKSMELRQDIRQFVEENPEVAAQLLKTWLRGGDDHG